MMISRAVDLLPNKKKERKRKIKYKKNRVCKCVVSFNVIFFFFSFICEKNNSFVFVYFFRE